MSFKPYSRPSLTSDDIQAVLEVLESSFLTTGPKGPELEKLFCETFNAPYATTCANGTAALHLACLAMGIGPGDHVIVPGVTFLATANAVRLCGGEVIFCDVDPETGMMDLDLIQQAEARSPHKIKAVFVVHMGGYGADLQAIASYAEKKGWFVLEDACHALGGLVQDHPVGSCHHSDVSTFSLHATKTFSAGEGGIIATRHPEIKEKMDRLRNHGMSRNLHDFQMEGAFDPSGEPTPWHYEMADLGLNYRLTDLQAALAISQIKRVDQIRQKRAELKQSYQTLLSGFSPILRPVPQKNPKDEPLLHLFQVLIDFEKAQIAKPDLMRRLKEDGVGTQVHYIPLHSQPYYQNRYGPLELPGAARFYEQVLALPFYTGLSLNDVEDVVAALHKALSL